MKTANEIELYVPKINFTMEPGERDNEDGDCYAEGFFSYRDEAGAVRDYPMFASDRSGSVSLAFYPHEWGGNLKGDGQDAVDVAAFDGAVEVLETELREVIAGMGE